MRRVSLLTPFSHPARLAHCRSSRQREPHRTCRALAAIPAPKRASEESPRAPSSLCRVASSQPLTPPLLDMSTQPRLARQRLPRLIVTPAARKPIGVDGSRESVAVSDSELGKML